MSQRLRSRFADLRTGEMTPVVERRGVGQAIGFKGHAAVFDQRTLIGGKAWGWYEVVAPGAFKDSIKTDDVRMLNQHDSAQPLARNTTKTLRLAEDQSGLATDADMTPTSYALDLALSLEAGDVTQMSFGFTVLKETVETLAESDPDYGKTTYNELRTIQKVKLWEVSPVTFPAYEGTDAQLAGDSQYSAHIAEILADTDLSDRADARQIIAAAHSLTLARMMRLGIEPLMYWAGNAGRALTTARGSSATTPATPTTEPTAPVVDTLALGVGARARRDLAAALIGHRKEAS